MAAADADATPADRVEIRAVDHAPQRPATTRLIAVDVIQCAAGIETGLQTKRDALGEPATQAQAGTHATPAQVLQAIALRRPGQPFGLFETGPGTVCIAQRGAHRRLRKTRLDELANVRDGHRAIALAQSVVEEPRQPVALLDRRAQVFVEAVLRAAMHHKILTGDQQTGSAR